MPEAALPLAPHRISCPGCDPVIGLDRLFCRNDHGYDGRTERGLCWMSERGARQWIRRQGPKRAVLVKTFKAKAAAIGMTLD